MNLFLVENDSTVDVIRALPEFDAARDRIVCFNYLPYVRLEQLEAKLNYCFVEDLFSEHDYRELHAATDRFAASWYRTPAGDGTVFRGVSFGAVTEIAFARNYLTTILVKYGEAIRAAVARYPGVEHIYHDLSAASSPVQLWLDDGGRYFNKSLLVAEVARQLGRPCHFLDTPVPIPPRFVGHFRSLLELHSADMGARAKFWVKKFARGLLNTVNGVLHERSPEGLYFSVYFNIDSVMDHARPGMIVPTPRPGNLLAPVRYLDLGDYPLPEDDERSQFQARLRERYTADKEIRTGWTFTFRDIDYRRLYAPVIEDLATRYIPRLCEYAARVEAALGDFQIRKFVAVDLITEMGKTHAAVCRKAGVEVIFVDHGIMGLRMIQQSARGAEPDLIIKPEAIEPRDTPYPYAMTAPAITLGNPSTDPYPASRRKRVRTIRKVLLTTFADNYYGRLDRFAWQELYFKELLGTIAPLARNGIEVHYRPHSENAAYHDYLFRHFGVDPSLVRQSSWRIPFRKLIYEMDVLVCSISNVFYEAQAAGVPTVFLDPHHIPDAMFAPFNGSNWEEVIRAGSGAEVVDIVLRNRDDPLELNRFLDRFLERYAPDYFYRLDGRAGERVMRWLFGQNA